MVFAALSFALSANFVNGQELRKIPRGVKVVVHNDFGSITITGSERETIEAVLTDSRRAEMFPVSISEKRLVSDKLLITVEPDRRYPKNNTRLEVKLPRYVELEPVITESSSITVSGIDGFVNATTGGGDIKIVNVGSVQARTTTGNINLEDIGGRTDIITGNGSVSVSRIKGDAKIIAVNAKINLSCVKGRVEINDTSSQIQLSGIEGDVGVSTFNGKAYFIGAIRSGNRYRLQTLSGIVSMAIPDDTGFTVVLGSYSGQIEKNFDFQDDSAAFIGKKGQGWRFTGKYGDGKAQIELDSFDGRVIFSKIAADTIKDCKSQTKD